jgi:hypothetical protein
MRGLLLDGAGQPDDLRGQTPLAGFQDPAIGISEAGEVEGQQVIQRALGLVEAHLELPRRGPEGRDCGLARRGHGAVRIAQQRLAGRGVRGDAPGREERVGFPRAQAVAGDGLGQLGLLGAREGGERERGRRREPTVVDVRGEG